MDGITQNLLEKIYTTDIFPFIAVTARFFGAMAIFAVLQDSFFSKMLKMSVALAFSAVIYPSLHTESLGHMANLLKWLYVFKEYLVGYLMGWIMSLPIWVIQGAGQFIDNQRGESMGALINPVSGTPSSSTGSLMIQSFSVYFLSMNGLLLFVSILFKSFSVYPVTDFLPLIDAHMIGNYIELFQSLFTWIVLLAMPVVAVMFIVEAVLGLLSTFLPQMNVTVLSLPVKSCVGIFIMILYLNNLYRFVLEHFIEKIKGVYV